MAFASPENNVVAASVVGDNVDDSKPPKLPQESLNEFWDGLITKTPGKVFQIFPKSLYANLLPPSKPEGVASTERALASYEEAARECKEKVRTIVRECHRTNEKFTDPDFNIGADWKRNCLRGLEIPTDQGSDGVGGRGGAVGARSLREAFRTLTQSKVLGQDTNLVLDVSALQNALDDDDSDSDSDDELCPATVHRVDYIFDDPSFLVDGYSSSDVQQGANGDCWWVAAVATLCSMPEIMEKMCVVRDAECGVYGFVFYRDGEWISTVVDDNLYLRMADFDAWGDNYDATGEKERKYKERYQTGSEALYFAKCSDKNETWLPLLEKAYAKVHGDYDAIQGGLSGEAVEDMTGGVTTTIYTDRILSKDKLWQELLNVNKDFIFAASSPGWWRDRSARQGVALNHAYSIMKAVEVAGEDDKKVRLVLIRNPWGRRAWNGVGEWNGPWSDGSKEWTPYWIKKLNHRFGDDGEFWMSFTDLCRKFVLLHRTRLFDDKWMVVQQWTSVNVSWVSGYLTTKFVIEIQEAGTVVIVLSQLDSRYFRRLEGQYSFHLQFLLQQENAKPGEYVVRVQESEPWPARSISAEINLEPGIYEVLPKISATRDLKLPIVEDVVKKAADENPQKLRQIGLNYDIAHAKGGFEEEEEMRKKKKLAKEKKLKEEKLKEEKLKEEKLKEEKLKEEKLKKENTEKEKPETEKTENGKTDEVTAETKKAEVKPEKGDDEKVEGKAKEEAKPDAEASTKEVANEGSPKGDADKSEINKKEESVDKKVEGEMPSGEKKSEPQPNTDGEAEPSKDEQPKPEDPKPESATEPAAKESPNPWNAVVVIGLRVYSKDPKLTVKLVKPKDPEEAAMLNVDGGLSGAGATS